MQSDLHNHICQKEEKQQFIAVATVKIFLECQALAIVRLTHYLSLTKIVRITPYTMLLFIKCHFICFICMYFLSYLVKGKKKWVDLVAKAWFGEKAFCYTYRSFVWPTTQCLPAAREYRLIWIT